MRISPSIASADLLNIAQEIDFIDRYFDSIHLDIEDGNAVKNITFGFKLCQAICEYSKSTEKTLHLEVIDPLKYIQEIKACECDVVFLQADCLDDPLEIAKKMREEQIPVGMNLSYLDRKRTNLKDLIDFSDSILINTTHHDDIFQVCDLEMLKFALMLAENGKKVWVDGGISLKIVRDLMRSNIYSAVMGRGVFSNKKKAIQCLVDSNWTNFDFS